MTVTNPRIFDAQQSPNNVQLLEAQSYAYSQAKKARNARFALLLIVAAATTAVSVFAASTESAKTAVSVVGMMVGFGADIFSRHRVAGRVALAVSIQEKFDTDVFQIPWNGHLTRVRPTHAQVAELAAKYTGDRFTEPWYPDTGTVHRPLDILLCQQSNLAWGGPTHRRWAWTLVSATTAVAAIPVVLWVTDVLTGSAFLRLALLPWAPLLLWAVTEILDHIATAREKADAHQGVLAQWHAGLAGSVDDSECRSIQNEIAHSRLRNAVTPDWFDIRNRARNEKTMKDAAASMRNEAATHGKA